MNVSYHSKIVEKSFCLIWNVGRKIKILILSLIAFEVDPLEIHINTMDKYEFVYEKKKKWEKENLVSRNPLLNKS